jgi:triacylglycerol lipase
MNILRRILSGFVLTFLLVVTALAQAPERKQVEILGQKIYYLEAGSAGPTVILLHGLGGDATNWALTIPTLAKTYRVLAPDQIGFGQSDKPLLNYRIGTYVEFLARFYQKLGITKATLVGNSLGGWISAAFTLAHPDKVEKLVLVDAAGLSPKRWNGPEMRREEMALLNPATIEDTKKLLVMILANKAMVNEQMAEQMLIQRMQKGDGNTINRLTESILLGQDWLDGKLGAIRTPTLVVWGREDLLTPLGIGKAFAADIKGAELVVFENCGHVPQMEVAPKFNEALLRFLSKAAASTASAK